jgi:hypothetical protein
VTDSGGSRSTVTVLWSNVSWVCVRLGVLSVVGMVA